MKSKEHRAQLKQVQLSELIVRNMLGPLFCNTYGIWEDWGHEHACLHPTEVKALEQCYCYD